MRKEGSEYVIALTRKKGYGCNDSTSNWNGINQELISTVADCAVAVKAYTEMGPLRYFNFGANGDDYRCKACTVNLNALEISF